MSDLEVPELSAPQFDALLVALDAVFTQHAAGTRDVFQAVLLFLCDIASRNNLSDVDLSTLVTKARNNYVTALHKGVN